MQRRGGRRGLTLVEVAVVAAILALIAAVGIPAISGILGLQQRAAAMEIARTWRWMLDEAAMRNATFRIAFDLDAGTWRVEVGDPDTVVFQTPEERERHDQELRDAMRAYTRREIEEGAAEEELERSGGVHRFEGLSETGFVTEHRLPDTARFAYVWTPQYGEDGARPHADGEEVAEDEHAIAYAYVFPDRTAEHAVVRIVDRDDPEDGWTIEVLPLSGEVRLTTDEVDPAESLAWVPDEAPRIR